MICPPEKTDWYVDRNELIALLNREWLSAEVHLADVGATSARDVVWSLWFAEGDLTGSQNRNGKTIYLNGPLTTIARFASWWRSQVPAQQSLLLSDETYTTIVNLDPGMTEQEILLNWIEIGQ